MRWPFLLALHSIWFKWAWNDDRHTAYTESRNCEKFYKSIANKLIIMNYPQSKGGFHKTRAKKANSIIIFEFTRNGHQLVPKYIQTYRIIPSTAMTKWQRGGFSSVQSIDRMEKLIFPQCIWLEHHFHYYNKYSTNIVFSDGARYVLCFGSLVRRSPFSCPCSRALFIFISNVLDIVHWH